MNSLKWLKKRFWWLVLLILIPVFLTITANVLVEHNSKGKTFSKSDVIPKNRVGLVLGTAKRLKSGYLNLYFKYRIEATVELYRKGKIEFILISGDNSSKGYDEPTDFKDALIAKGIPEEKIYLDYAGFRTLDSVVRAKKIFGQDNITIISQQFHNERAIFIAEHYGIKAIGFNARTVSARYGIKVKWREYLARTKVFIDLVFGVNPKFLGKTIDIK